MNPHWPTGNKEITEKIQPLYNNANPSLVHIINPNERSQGLQNKTESLIVGTTDPGTSSDKLELTTFAVTAGRVCAVRFAPASMRELVSPWNVLLGENVCLCGGLGPGQIVHASNVTVSWSLEGQETTQASHTEQQPCVSEPKQTLNTKARVSCCGWQSFVCPIPLGQHSWQLEPGTPWDLTYAALPLPILLCVLSWEYTANVGIMAFLSSLSPSNQWTRGWSWGLLRCAISHSHILQPREIQGQGQIHLQVATQSSFQKSDFVWEASPSCFSRVPQLRWRARLHLVFRSWWGGLITEKRPMEEIKKRRGGGKAHISNWSDSKFPCKLHLFLK